MGPITYIRHLLSGPRLPFTAAYFGSIALTLYFAVGVRPLAFLLTLLRLYANEKNIVTKKLPHLVRRYIPACCADMVSGQLFPHGKYRVAIHGTLWSAEGCGLG